MTIRSALATLARMTSVVSSSVLVAGLLTASDVQAFEITQAQRVACTPDVMRLCASEYPDPTRVIACMRANKSQVSAACVAVIPAKAWNASTRVAAR